MPTAVRVAIALAAVAGFAAMLWLGARAESRVECELCLTFQGRTECRTGRGADEATAAQSARTNACAVLAHGVTESFQCSATPPKSLVCRER